MADELEGRIISELNRTAAVIRVNMQAKGINASGRTSESIHVRESSGGFQLVGGGIDTAPFTTVEVGRPGGNVPGGMVLTKNGTLDVSNTFKAILIQWASDKGIDMDWGGATMLGRRIAAVGTIRHQKNEDVYSTAAREAMVNIRDICRQHVQSQVSAAISGFGIKSGALHL